MTFPGTADAESPAFYWSPGCGSTGCAEWLHEPFKRLLAWMCGWMAVGAGVLAQGPQKPFLRLEPLLQIDARGQDDQGL